MDVASTISVNEMTIVKWEIYPILPLRHRGKLQADCSYLNLDTGGRLSVVPVVTRPLLRQNQSYLKRSNVRWYRRVAHRNTTANVPRRSSHPAGDSAGTDSG